MSYIGRGIDQIDNISKLDNITFNGGTTYPLTKDSSAFTAISSNAILISISGVIQQGNFSVDGTNIVFNTAVASSESCDFIMHYGTGVAFTPADSSVTKDKANFISTSSSAGLQIKGDGTTDGTLQLNCSQNTHGVKIKSPAHSASQSYTLTLPTTSPASNKMLQTDGSGNLSFVDAPSGGVTLLGSIESSSNSSTIAIDSVMDNSSYAYYIVEGLFNSAGNGATIEARFRDGGSALTASLYNFTNLAWEQAQSSPSLSTGSGSNHADIISNVGTRTFSFHGYIFPCLSIDNMGLSICDWTGKMSNYDSGNRRIRKVSGVFEFVNATVPDGFQIVNQTANFEDYEMRIYGVTR